MIHMFLAEAWPRLSSSLAMPVAQCLALQGADWYSAISDFTCMIFALGFREYIGSGKKPGGFERRIEPET